MEDHFKMKKKKIQKMTSQNLLRRNLPTPNRRSMHQYCQLLSRVPFVVVVFVIKDKFNDFRGAKSART